MSSKRKVDGVWRDVVAPYTKVAGTWKIAKSAWTKIDGAWRSWFIQGGVLDRPLASEGASEFNNFNTNLGTGFSSTVNSVKLQSDGKILVGGNFSVFNGVTAGRIVRLNSDGTLDTDFNSNISTGFNSFINTFAVQSDGKILVGGNFTTFNGVTVNCIVRLNSDGTRDTAFSSNLGTAFSSRVNTLEVQSDGKILVGGGFTTFNGTTRNRLVRLNSDGTEDTTFYTTLGTGFGSTINSVKVQSDGKILVGGAFTTLNGSLVNRFTRLNSDGTVDTAFAANTGTEASGGDVVTIAVQSDGKIILGGAFTAWNGVTVGLIVRLNSDGTRDTAFTTNNGTGFSTGPVDSIVVQSDGKILIGSEGSSFNGVSINCIVRLNSNGTIDTAFNANTGTGASAGAILGSVNSIAVQSDGKIILGGAFLSFNGITGSYIIQLNSDGTAPPVAGASSDILDIKVQSDNKILISGIFSQFDGIASRRIVRLNENGTVDTAFRNNIGEGATLPSAVVEITVRTLAVQSDGKIILGGNFSVFNGVTAGRIVRLNSDGTRDTAFDTNIGTGAANAVSGIAVQSDGKILLGGVFTTFNGVTANRIARLNSNGTLDTAFVTNTGTGPNSEVLTIAVQSDGKILVGGAFTTFNGVTANRIARLNSNGTLDTAFNSNIGTGANNGIRKIEIQSDGKILVSGLFSTFNGVAPGRIVRLNSDGTLDTAFNSNTGAGINGTLQTVALQSNGKILVGGDFTAFNGVTANYLVRLNSDGTLDTAFNSNIGTGANSVVRAIATQTDGKILLGGDFTALNGQPRYRLARIGGDIATTP